MSVGGRGHGAEAELPSNPGLGTGPRPDLTRRLECRVTMLCPGDSPQLLGLGTLVGTRRGCVSRAHSHSPADAWTWMTIIRLVMPFCGSLPRGSPSGEPMSTPQASPAEPPCPEQGLRPG